MMPCSCQLARAIPVGLSAVVGRLCRFDATLGFDELRGRRIGDDLEERVTRLDAISDFYRASLDDARDLRFDFELQARLDLAYGDRLLGDGAPLDLDELEGRLLFLPFPGARSRLR